MPAANIFLLIAFLILTACSGGGGGGDKKDPPLPGPNKFTLESFDLQNTLGKEVTKINPATGEGKFALTWDIQADGAGLKETRILYSTDDVLSSDDQKIFNKFECINECKTSCQFISAGTLSCESQDSIDLGLTAGQSQSGFFIIESCSDDQSLDCAMKSHEVAFSIDENPPEPRFSISAINIDTASKLNDNQPLIQTDIGDGNFFLEWDLTAENTELGQSEWYFSADEKIDETDKKLFTDTQCTTDCTSSCQLTKESVLKCGTNEIDLGMNMGETLDGFFLLRGCSKDDPAICDSKDIAARLTIEAAPVVPNLTIDSFELDTGSDNSEIISDVNSGNFSLNWKITPENTGLDSTKLYYSNDQIIGDDELISTDTQCTENCTSSCQLVKTGKLACDGEEVNLNMAMGQTQQGLFIIKSCSTDNPEICDSKNIQATLTIEDAPVIPVLKIDSVSLNNGSDGSEIITDKNNGDFSLGWSLTLENATFKQNDWYFSVDQTLDANDKKILTDTSCTSGCTQSCSLSTSGKLLCDGGIEVDLSLGLGESKAGFFLLKSCSQNEPENCDEKTLATTLTIENPFFAINNFSITTSNNNGKVRSDENNGNFALNWDLTLKHTELTHSTLYYSDDNSLSDDDHSVDTNTQCQSDCQSSCQLTQEGKLNCGAPVIDLAMTPDQTKNGHFILESCPTHEDLDCLIETQPIEFFIPAIPSITITQFDVTSQATNGSDPTPIHHGVDSGKFDLNWDLEPEHTEISQSEIFFSTDAALSDDDLSVHTSSCDTNCETACRLTSANRLSCDGAVKQDLHSILQTATAPHLILKVCNDDDSVCATSAQAVSINAASTLEIADVTLTPFAVTKTSDALIDLKSIDTLIELKDFYDLSADEDLGIGKSNLIGIKSNMTKTFPYKGISDGKIIELVVNPTNQTHYFEIGQTSGSKDPLGHVYIDNQGMNIFGPSAILPIEFCENKPCSQYETVDRISSSCPEGSIYNNVASACVTHISGIYNGVPDEIRVEILFSQIQELLNESHLACKFVEVNPRTNAYQCLGGNVTVDSKLNFHGFEIPVQARISKLIYVGDDRFSSTAMQYNSFKLNKMAFNDNGDAFIALKQDLNSGNKLIIREHDQATSEVLEVNTGLSHNISLEAVLTGDQFLFTGNPDGLIHNGEFTELNMSSNVTSFGDSALVDLTGFSYNLIQTNNDDRIVKVPLSWSGIKIGSSASFYNNKQSRFSVVPSSSVGRVNLFPFQRQPVNTSTSTANLKENYDIKLSEYNYLDITPAKYFIISNWDHTKTIELLKHSNDISYALDITNFDIENNVLKFTAKRVFQNTGYIYGEIDLLAAFAGEPQENFLRLTEKSEAFAQYLETFYAIVKTGKNKPEAPSINKFHFDTHEFSQIGIEFSEPMDKASVQSAISLTRGDETVSYITAWFGDNLFILPDPLPLDASSDTYQGFFYNTEYTLTIDPFTAKDTTGQLLSDSIDNPDTISKTFNFGHINGFVIDEGVKLEESQFAEGKTAGMLNAAYYKRFGKNIDSDTWGSFYGSHGQNHGKRYYKLLPLTYNSSTNYRLEFDLFAPGNSQWGIAIAPEDVQFSLKGESSLSKCINYWCWILSDNPDFGSDYGYVASKVTGFYKPGTIFKSYPSLSSSATYSLTNEWQRYRLEVKAGSLELYLFDEEMDSYIRVSSEVISNVTENAQANIWVSFLSRKSDAKYSVTLNQLDNITFSTIKNENGEWVVDEILEHTDFEDESDPFKGFTGLKQTATKEITPLKLLED